MFYKTYSVFIERFRPLNPNQVFDIEQALCRGGEVVIVQAPLHYAMSLTMREEAVRDVLTEEQNLVTHFVATADPLNGEPVLPYSVIEAIEALSESHPILLATSANHY